jgi:hypothetical protein
MKKIMVECHDMQVESELIVKITKKNLIVMFVSFNINKTSI